MKTENKLKQQLKKLPNSPGVYFFKKGKKILYIGKAGSLKNRVRSYFTAKDSKTKELVNTATKIDFIKTDSVLEALIYEANLIQKYWPDFNILGKDNRSFTYIAISKTDKFPAPIIIRGKYLKKYPSNNFHIFGPYTSFRIVKTALNFLRKIFPYCQHPNLGRPCFHFQIGLCPGPCANKINQKDYKKITKNLILFLSGKKIQVIKNLKKSEPEKIEILKHIQDSSLISREKVGEDLSSKQFRIEGYDISHFAGKGSYGSMVVFENNQPKTDDYRLFKIKTAIKKDDVGALKEVLIRRLNHKEWNFPDIFLIDGGIGQVNAVFQILNQKHIHEPIVGLAKGKSKIDKMILKNVDKDSETLIKSLKNTFQQVRNEAHRFAIKFSRKKIQKVI
jgi:excinuclease ABC subunit C